MVFFFSFVCSWGWVHILHWLCFSKVHSISFGRRLCPLADDFIVSSCNHGGWCFLLDGDLSISYFVFCQIRFAITCNKGPSVDTWSSCTEWNFPSKAVQIYSCPYPMRIQSVLFPLQFLLHLIRSGCENFSWMLEIKIQKMKKCI